MTNGVLIVFLGCIGAVSLAPFRFEVAGVDPEQGPSYGIGIGDETPSRIPEARTSAPAAGRLRSRDQGSEVIGFDCSGYVSGLSAISLTSIKPCPKPEEYGQMTAKEIQIVQYKQYKEVHVKTCLIKVARHITHCGAFSHSAQVVNGIREWVKFVGKENCARIHETNGFQFGHAYIDEINPNSTRFASVVLVGTVTSEGSCTGSDYSDQGYNYHSVLVQAMVEIKINDYTVFSDHESSDGQIHLRTGAVCPYSKGYCVDYEAGEVLWETSPKQDCKDEDYDVLWQGVGNYTIVPGVRNVTYALVADGTNVFALQLLSKIQMCNQLAYQTEHERIFIFEVNSFGFFPFKQNYNSAPLAANADQLAYYNTKYSAQEVMSLKRINDLQTASIYGRCMVQRELMQARLSLASINPDTVIKAVKGTPGHVGTVMGDVLYVTKCQPVMVTIRNTTKCYDQLPVVWKGEEWYLARDSKALIQHGEEVTCAEVLTPTFNLNGTWVSFTPDKTLSRLTPEVLQPEPDQPLDFRPLHELAAGGIYSEDVMKKLQSNLQHQNQRQAVMNVITRRIMGEDADMSGYQTHNLFTSQGLEELSSSMLGRLGLFFHKFGDICSVIIGMACIGYVGKLILDVTFYGRLLHGAFGCGWALIGGMCTGMAGALLHKQHTREAKRWRREYDVEAGRGGSGQEESQRVILLPQIQAPVITEVTEEITPTHSREVTNINQQIARRLRD